MRSKGALPVPYIVAIIIAVIVIVVILVWFFMLSGKGTNTATDAFCRAREFTYCTTWAASSYDPAKIPGGKTGFCCGPDSYANECSSSNWASSVGQAECKSILGQNTTS